ncbi:type II toxin-antitoxin system HicB family antitoxin [Nitrosococcus watsonii]|uniref:Type II toxin-antitoxin system HicB family antitoxin n=1 Tax=Nitrosococcus watsoni (strain C-113) TaxID=105559 RepID=D8K6C0_NITWC|nr:hypothetical protein [Nitrosococcus watsonii]ADJ28447.1 conserved hypothetical protein [Nitrosococcus watsonii C-113]
MMRKKYIYWKDDDMWLGYLEEFPDHWTQGETEEELKEHLIDIYKELTSGNIPNVRRIAEIEIS